jgi:hypothetical protein
MKPIAGTVAAYPNSKPVKPVVVKPVEVYYKKRGTIAAYPSGK